MNIEMLEYKFIENPGFLFEQFLVLKDIGVNEMGVPGFTWGAHSQVSQQIKIQKLCTMEAGTHAQHHTLLNCGECGEWNTKYGPTWQWIQAISFAV